jgi:hypothetical protein
MAANTDWLPTRRELQIAMARTWLRILLLKATEWGIPSSVVTELTNLTDEAEAALNMAMSSERTSTVTAHCKTAFGALTEKMRFIKSRYFLSPPLTDEDFGSLGLKPQSVSKNSVPPPASQAEAEIGRPGVHLLELYLRPMAGSPADPHRSDYGFRIYYGILPIGGASTEGATGPKHELLKVPISGEELTFSKFTRRKKERFDFAQEDSGKTVYFCIRYENAKGESGPWGPVFSSVIP